MSGWLDNMKDGLLRQYGDQLQSLVAEAKKWAT